MFVPRTIFHSMFPSFAFRPFSFVLNTRNKLKRQIWEKTDSEFHIQSLYEPKNETFAIALPL